MQQELIEMLEEIIPYVEVWHKEDQDVLDKAEALVEKAKNNNAPAVQQGEPVAAWLKAKIEKHALLAADCPGSSSVVLKSALLRFLDRLPPVAATPAPVPALLEFAEEVRRTGDTRLASMAIALLNTLS